MKTIFLLVCLLHGIIGHGQVTPFLPTSWNQTCNYNAQCPPVGSGGACGNAFTGCNATAWGQIMKYYNFPVTTMGGLYCNSNFPTECVDFSAQSYNYSLMPNSVTSSAPEVAKLLYHLGVVQDMQWNGSNSTSFFDNIPLKRYFKYSPKMYNTATFLFSSTADLIEAIKNELDNGRPVYAKGGGHFYLIDGYNASNQFHMNFGWGGVYDGYYDITNVSNGAGTFTPSNFQFNIMPMSGDLEAGKDTIYVSATGTSQSYEFTSLSNWTATTNQTWINLNLTSGNSGYFNNNDGANLTCSVNNDSVERYGAFYLQNATETDTIVVVQEASPLNATPEPLNFSDAGGIQTVLVDYFTWSNWNLSISDTWLSASNYSGAGGTTVDINCSANTSTSSRNAWLIFTGGVFTDSVLVTQIGASITPYLTLSPDTLQYTYSGGSQAISVDINTDSTWQILGTPAWLSASTLSGTGPATVSITCTLNLTNLARSFWVNIQGVGLTDSVYVMQEEHPLSVNTSLLNDLKIDQQNDRLLILSEHEINVSLYDLKGQKIGEFNQNQINISNLSKGIYLIVINEKPKITTKKIRID
jgi:hypothetical protein